MSLSGSTDSLEEVVSTFERNDIWTPYEIIKVRIPPTCLSPRYLSSYISILLHLGLSSSNILCTLASLFCQDKLVVFSFIVSVLLFSEEPNCKFSDHHMCNFSAPLAPVFDHMRLRAVLYYCKNSSDQIVTGVFAF